MTTDLIARPSGDEQLIALWLHGRPEHTQRAYRADVARLLAFVDTPLPRLSLDQVQAFADSLSHLSPESRHRTLSGIKSLLTFGHRIGYLPVNVGAALRLPSRKNTLAERIMTEEQVQQILAKETDRRAHLLIRLLYASGGRLSEVCRLHWRDAQPRGNAGQVTLFGKGGKTRVVLLSNATWAELVCARVSPDSDAPIFTSRKGGALSTTQAWRLVKAAAQRAGLPDVSPHWFRHAHASHALDRGAPIGLVRDTLGHSGVAITNAYLHARPEESSSKYLGV